LKLITSLRFLPFAIATSIYSQATFADEIVIAADPWCPYACEPGSEKPGFMVEVTRKIFEKSGHNIVYKNKPWARALSDSRNGKTNGVFGAFKSDAPNHAFPSEAIGMSTTPFYVKNDADWKYSDTTSLTKVTLGVIRDYSYGDNIDNYLKKTPEERGKIQIVTTLESQVKKLIHGRITTFPEDRMVVGWYLKKNNLTGQLKEAGIAIEAEDLYLAFSPKLEASKQYTKIFDEGIIALRKNGTLAKILNRYGVSDWK